MKSLIVTTQYVNNYGAVLQAYGLHKFLERNNWEHVFLNQETKSNNIFSHVKPFGANSVYVAINNVKNALIYFDLKKRKSRFDEFRMNFLPQTSRCYASGEMDDLDAYDILITGGDQMFNRTCLNRPVNLLNFGRVDAHRISYGTSFGSYSFSESEMKWLIGQLARYESLSIREENVSIALSKKLNTPIFNHIDAAFLATQEEYSLAACSIDSLPEHFILVYELMPHQETIIAIDAFRKKYNVPVVSICTGLSNRLKVDYCIRNAGPAEFLWLFKSADAVVTTSFHGTVFSIINHKPFYCLLKKNEQRMPNLLRKTNLEQRGGFTFEDSDDEIDFSYADQYIDRERISSKEYFSKFYEQ